ncbi:MAG: hypothetical protein B2I17_00855 [Thermoplasmatales archaeon B_DKE]|nr:MAG: hypothetical protein B2I17_00855 [Thermoplasmatales archaeon B_DKE]
MTDKIPDINSPDRLRVFVSNSYLDRSMAMKIRNRLGEYGINVYIAHNERDVSPILVEKILENISTTTVFIPLLTRNFFSSEWTMQECGAAVALAKLIVSVSVEAEPVGYLGKFTSIKPLRDPDGSINTESLCNELLKFLYTKGIITNDHVIKGFTNAMTFTEANYAAEFLKEVDETDSISIEEATRLFTGSMDNLILKGSFKASKILTEILEKYKESLSRETIEQLSQKKIL